MNRFDIAHAQAKAWSILSRSHTAGKVASTYLFHGPEGVGAWPLALEFAALLNCDNPRQDETDPRITYPCHECRPCRQIEEINFEGLYFAVPVPPHKKPEEAIDKTNEVLDLKRQEPFAPLDRTANIGIPISLAREIKRSLSIHGGEGITRVALFYQMDRMRAQSADALLKLIEEPPSDTVIILTAARPEVLLETIQSRSQKIRLERLPEPMMVPYLTSRYDVSDKRATLLSRISEGRLGQAIQMLASDDEESEGARAVGLMLFKSLLTQGPPEVVSQISDLVNLSDRGAVEDLLKLWQSLLRDCSYYVSTGDQDELVNVDFIADIKQLSPQFADSTAVVRMVDILKNSLADLGLNVHIQPALVAMVLRLKSCLEGSPEDVGREALGG